MWEQISELRETLQNYKDDYSVERGWKKAVSVSNNRLKFDSLFDRVNEVIEEDKKFPETKRKELEYLQAHPWETEEGS